MLKPSFLPSLHPPHPAPQRGLFKYTGQWEVDLQQGEGKCIYADGSQYDGQWAAGQRCAGPPVRPPAWHRRRPAPGLVPPLPAVLASSGCCLGAH